MSSPGTPLWPAGHLPLKEGDWLSSRLSQIADTADEMPAPKLLISPLVEEMPGRAEGGASHCRSLILECVG